MIQEQGTRQPQVGDTVRVKMIWGVADRDLTGRAGMVVNHVNPGDENAPADLGVPALLVQIGDRRVLATGWHTESDRGAILPAPPKPFQITNVVNRDESRVTTIHRAVNRTLATVLLILAIIITGWLVLKGFQLQRALSNLGDSSSSQTIDGPAMDNDPAPGYVEDPAFTPPADVYQYPEGCHEDAATNSVVCDGQDGSN